MSLCEWNRERGGPAMLPDSAHPGNCRNEATVSVGGPGWHLCDSCAALPEFARYTRRKPLKQARKP